MLFPLLRPCLRNGRLPAHPEMHRGRKIPSEWPKSENDRRNAGPVSVLPPRGSRLSTCADDCCEAPTRTAGPPMLRVVPHCLEAASPATQAGSPATQVAAPPNDSATMEHLDFQYDISRGAMRRFNEARYPLVSPSANPAPGTIPASGRPPVSAAGDNPGFRDIGVFSRKCESARGCPRRPINDLSTISKTAAAGHPCCFQTEAHHNKDTI